MYVGEGQMIHASSSRGVIESPIDQNYWNTHYKGSGRIPLIAQLVPIPQPEKPVELPTPEAPLLADNTPKVEIDVAFEPTREIVSTAPTPSVNATTPVTVSDPTPAHNTTTVADPEPQPDAELAVVTVTSAFADATSTRVPLTRKTKTKSETNNKATDTDNSATTQTETPDEAPAVIVRNAFGGASKHD